MFPLECSAEELESFIKGSTRNADGWIGFYWGQTIDDYAKGTNSISAALTRRWLESFRSMTPEMMRLGAPTTNSLSPAQTVRP